MPVPKDLEVCNVDRSNFELVAITCNSPIESIEDCEEPLTSIIHIVYDTIVFALVKWSIIISAAQVIFLGVLICVFGTVPVMNNPYWGPSVNVLIKYGAKDAELIMNNFEYWRLLSAIMLHAGVYHLLANISLQILISGYLEQTWGVIIFFGIYFTTGLVGYLCSCCFLYDSVSVGSSGSIMGLLASWLLDIVFSLQRLRAERNLRAGIINSQIIMLCSITTAILLTLASSWNSGVDWASHAGGCLYGALWACALFTDRPSTFKGNSDDIISNNLNSRVQCIRWTIKALSISLLFIIPSALGTYMICHAQVT